MSAIAGWRGVLQETGAAVPVTGEACAFVSGTDPNKVYQVTNAARHVWDPTVAVTIKDGGVAVGAANYSFDFLSGTITFIGHTVTGAVTVDGSYLPVIAVAQVRKSSLKLNHNQLDCSNFDDATGWRAYTQGVAGGSVDVEMLSMPSAQFDVDVGGQFTYLNSGRRKVLILGDTSNTKKWRLWMLEANLQQDVDVMGLVTANMTWTQAANTGATISYNT